LLGLPPGHWQFQRIKGVVSTPTMRPDGTLLIDEGYDDMTGLLLVEPPAMPPIPAMPTKDEGRLALNLLKELLQEVLFIEDEGVSLAVALSVLLTPIVRGAFNMAPLHVVRAPAAGSGKSYMFDIASEIATGGPLNILSAADGNAEELRKRIDTAMLEGQPIISIDNFSGDLKSSSLAQYVERQLVNIRVLGESKSVEVDTSGTTFGVNGNNLVITGADLPRRTIQAMIDTKMEKPEFREYKIDPVQMIRADRSKYIAACLTVCLAYRAAGQPGKMVINSFAGWSDTVRSALMWLGEADPVKSQERVREDDTELSALGDFLTQTALEMGVDRLYFMHEIVKASRTSTVGAGHEEVDYDSPEFHQAVFRIGSRNGKAADPLLASRWARTMVKRIENGLFLDMEQRKGGTAKWVIRRTPFNKTEYPGQRNLEHEHDGKIKVLRPKPTMGNNEQS
jgi:hypothetical protein